MEIYIFAGTTLPPYLRSARNKPAGDEKWGRNMPTVNKTGGIEPLPRYVMPDTSVPAYDEILAQLQEYHRSRIGSSYYYIRADHEDAFLCRIVPGGGKIFFHEVVDHEKHGISDADIEAAVKRDPGVFTTPGYYPISSHIEDKLRILFEYP